MPLSLAPDAAGKFWDQGFLAVPGVCDPQEIDCKYDSIKGLVLRAEFVKKR